MRKRAAAALLALSLLSGCGQPSSPAYIGAEEAKRLALQACGLTADAVDQISTDMTTQEGRDRYQVELTASSGQYCYQVDALTGEVALIWTRDAAPEAGAAEGADPASPEAVSTVPDPVSTAPEAPAPSLEGGALPAAPPPSAQAGPPAQTAPPASGTIGVEAAKAAALAHAGIDGAAAAFLQSELDWEDGRAVYEIDFRADGREYEYEIDGASGTVLSWSVEEDAGPPAQTAPSAGGTIGPEEAKALALARVPGASAGNLREFETDYEHGRTEYEGEIVYGGVEYGFKIDGGTGVFLSWEVESR